MERPRRNRVVPVQVPERVVENFKNVACPRLQPNYAYIVERAEPVKGRTFGGFLPQKLSLDEKGA